MRVCRDESLFPFNDIPLEQNTKHFFVIGNVIGNAPVHDEINSNLLDKLQGLMETSKLM